MIYFRSIGLVLVLAAFAACGRESQENVDETGEEPTVEPQTTTTSPEEPVTRQEAGVADGFQIESGLTARVLREGSGETASPGQTAVVHYTGWLYDEQAPDNRGEKFDSSVDRDQHFVFPLGAGRVIDGWDRGVAGMQVGEVRELTIAPELAYGQRGAGDAIPPGATLVFEVELADVQDGEAD